MMLTAETLTRHELIGLHVRVVEASNSTLVGREGEVVMETTNTLSVAVAHEGEESRLVRVPKADATFEFRLPPEESAEQRSAKSAEQRSAESAEDGSDDDAGAEYVVVEGKRLVARPARRTERTGDSRWQ